MGLSAGSPGRIQAPPFPSRALTPKPRGPVPSPLQAAWRQKTPFTEWTVKEEKKYSELSMKALQPY